MSGSKGDTEIKMNFTTGNVASARNMIREVYRNQLADMKAVNQQAGLLNLNFRKMGRSMLYGIAGYAGVTGVSTMLSSFGRTYSAITEKSLELQRAITPLSSLGDNAKDLESLRQTTVGLSVALGDTTQNVAEMLFNLQSGTANLSSDQVDDLRVAIVNLAKASGGSLVTSEKLVTGSFQNFGDEINNVTQLSNKLMYTQREASLTFEELGSRLPEVAAAAATVGATFDESMAMIVAGTQKRIPVEKFFTGLRNVLLILDDEEKQRKTLGRTFSGSFIDRVEQLREVANDPRMSEGFKKAFGQETVVPAMVLVNAVDEMNTAFKDLNKIAGDTDTAMQVIAERMKDPVFAGNVTRSINQKLSEEMPNLVSSYGIKGLKGIGRRMSLGRLASQEMFGVDKDSPLASLGAYIAGLGLGGALVNKGLDLEMKYTLPGAERDALLEQEYLRKRAKDIRYYDPRGEMTWGEIISGDRGATVERMRRAYADAYPEFDAEAANKARPYIGDQTGRASMEAQTLAMSDEGKAILRELRGLTDATRENTRAVSRGGVGGSRANSEEGL